MKFTTIAFIFLTFLAVSSCEKEKDDLADTESNEMVDVNSLEIFENEIQSGVSMIFYHASWCTNCAAQRPAVEAVSEKMDFNAVFFGEVEFDDNRPINEAYNVTSFPTIVIYKAGVEQERFSGRGHSEAKLTARIDALL